MKLQSEVENQISLEYKDNLLLFFQSYFFISDDLTRFQALNDVAIYHIILAKSTNPYFKQSVFKNIYKKNSETFSNKIT